MNDPARVVSQTDGRCHLRTMTDAGIDNSATSSFFEELGARSYLPVLEKTDGVLRFEISDGRRRDRWIVSVRHGEVDISSDLTEGHATCVIRASRAAFDGIVLGEVNAMASLLRGELTVDGDLQLLMQFQRVFPGPAGSQRCS